MRNLLCPSSEPDGHRNVTNREQHFFHLTHPVRYLLGSGSTAELPQMPQFRPAFFCCQAPRAQPFAPRPGGGVARRSGALRCYSLFLRFCQPIGRLLQKWRFRSRRPKIIDGRICGRIRPSNQKWPFGAKLSTFLCGRLLFNNELYNQKMSNALAKIATFAIYIDP